MKRRSFLQALCGLVGIGLAPKAEAAIETKLPENYGRDLTLVEYGYSIKVGPTTTDFSTYRDPRRPHTVHLGHVFTCENGHPMCEAIATIPLGELRWDRKVGNWKQGLKRPRLGDPFPICPTCGTKLVMWQGPRGPNTFVGIAAR